MKTNFTIFFVIVVVSSSFCQVNSEIDKIKYRFAPDRRTSVFEIYHNKNTNTVIGKTNSSSAKKELLNKLKAYNVIDSITVLPDETVGSKIWGVVNVSLSNIRAQPIESAEMASQALLGTRLKILEKQKSWYRVQTPDDYIGWVNGSTITKIDEKQYQELLKAPKLIYIQPFGFARIDTTDLALPVADLTLGNLLILKDKTLSYSKIEFPDKRIAYVKNNEVIDTQTWLNGHDSTTKALVKYAYNFTGVPYLWGGTSFKGVDCSGFARMAYFSQGMYLPRDASQQAKLGQLVSISNDFANLKEGDLLYFGNLETKRVLHVAIWVGNKSFIHSSGMVRINSFDTKSPFYDEYNLNRLLYVKRVEPNSIKLSGQNLYKF
jgi:gamma-D-glutamyl-L-lysine dipeptidyl-peptidase